MINIGNKKGRCEMKYCNAIAAAAMALSLATVAWAESGHHGEGHHHDDETFSAGEPGDPGKPVRVVPVTMSETDGKMVFMPDKLEVKKGDQVRFVLRNNGELDHEFILATTAENLKHAEAMKKNPDMEHDDPNGKRLAPKKTGELLWKFSKAGEFEYACLIPGHREGGMVGKVVVK